MRRLRKASQAAFLAAFLAGLILPGLFLRLERLSPLLGVSVSLASRTVLVAFWPCLLLVVSALFFGRAYCSWACPLGTCVDCADWLLPHPRTVEWKRLKYYLLAFVVAAAVFGLEAASYFDPLSIAPRGLAAVGGYLLRALGVLAGLFSGLPAVGPAAARASGALERMKAGLDAGHLSMLSVLAGVLVLGLLGRRFWCRNVCPLGALLGLLGEWSLFRRKVDSCTDCRLCRASCPMLAIPEEPEKTVSGECTLCFECARACPRSCVTFAPGTGRHLPAEVDLQRRYLLAGAAAGVLLGPALKLRRPQPPLRPPGAREEEEFLDLCIRCGECIASCPQGALLPSLAHGLWTPVLVPRVGYCDYSCVNCLQSCPTGAIERLTAEEKKARSVGYAVIDRSRCLLWRGEALWKRTGEWTGEYSCLVCEEMCPVPEKAIKVMVGGPGIRLPRVDEKLCVGCGRCENVCPVPGDAAVRVLPQRRRLEGGGISPFLPRALPGWRLLRGPEAYPGMKLFDLIDGAAVVHVSYSFEACAAAVYEDESGARAELQLYRFGTSADAWGLYSEMRFGAERKVELAQEAAASGSMVMAWRGRYYLEMRPLGARELSPGLLALARAGAEAMPESGKAGERPEALKLLPPGYGPGTERYFHGKVVLDKIVPVAASEKALGLGPGIEGVEGVGAKYGDSDLALLLYPTQARARQALRAVVESEGLGEEGGVFRGEEVVSSARGRLVALSAKSDGSEPGEKEVRLVRLAAGR